jgi:lipopolysaccharide/colanic/teichoic acid biosynthesis glycosyltransferase
VHLLRQKGAGPAAARNAGAATASDEIIAFTDSDCAPDGKWLAELTRPFQDPAVVGSKGTYRTHQRNVVARFVQLEYQSKYDRMRKRTQIDFIDTYCAAYRRAAFLENGGFDTAFPVPSVEDQEFSFRLSRKGYRLVFVPDAVVFHRHVETVLAYARRKFRIGFEKARMLRWLPERVLGDSHTPLSERLQIALLGLALLFGAAGLLWPPGLWLALGTLVVFLVSALPFLGLIARSDPVVLVLAPVLLLVRAAALGLGLVCGALFGRETSRRESGPGFLSWACKRALDILGALIGLVLASPFLLFAAVAIRLDSPGPALFVQERVGQGGRVFRMVKLRTMVRDAQDRVHEVLSLNPLQGPVYKVPNDPRVTRVGRFLRRSSLDEVPQLWNVLKGEMSLVGPRPEECWVVACYNDRERQRLAMKPGLTGPMQVNGRGELDMEERLNLELDYIGNYTLGRDLAILVRTFPAMISGRGAV